jgi:hypothetical protein
MSAQELDGSVICAEQYSGVVSSAIMVPIGIVGWIKRSVRGASPRGENPTAAGVLLGDAGATPTDPGLILNPLKCPYYDTASNHQ